MRKSKRILAVLRVVILFAAVAQAVSGCTKPSKESSTVKETSALKEPTSLFDGKTFTGWEGDLNWFRIADGAIVAGKLTEDIPHNFFLAMTKEYYNFELQLKVKTSSKPVNAGIQFRSKRIPNHHEVSGYQADIGEGYWGGLYDESRRNRLLVPIHAEVQKTIKDNDWNDYKIRCVNDRIQLFLNGVKTVDYTETDPEIAKQAGIIALQIHGGPPAEAWYKDITIKELRAFDGANPQSKLSPGSNIALLGTASMDFPPGGAYSSTCR
jgi:hypothetical protein